MSLTEIKEVLQKLKSEEMEELTHWMNARRLESEEANADAWDKQFESDVNEGRLNHLIVQVEANFKAGRSRAL